jgi:AcrR family transcriptional regulator
MPTVKRVGARAERTRQTRQRILDAARDLFVEHGYGATALQDVAAKAGVAVQTIYFAFGNKRMLLKELVDVTVAGDDEPVATMDRPWFRSALAAETAEDQLRAHVAGSSAVLRRVAPIMTMLEAAVAGDPELSRTWETDENPRLIVQRAAAESLVTKPGVLPSLTAADATDLLYAVLSPELYLLLVRDRGWSRDRWEQWAFATLRPQLCQT